MAAKQIFPKSSLAFNGWTGFIARRSRLIDLPFAQGLLKVQNRYRAWASIANVPWQQVERFYVSRMSNEKSTSIMIHVGAQWRSRQYPNVGELATALREFGPVQIVAGYHDPLPTGVDESHVSRLMDHEFLDKLRASSHVIANDSSPMHLAPLMRCRTTVISRLSAIEQWIPPTVNAICSNKAPKGYRPDPAYESDSVISGWPTVEEVVKSFRASYAAK
jgi:ADP-heptose:LPS heptosyltransferase